VSLRRPRRLVMASYITGAASLFESGLDVGGVYKVHGSSGNLYFVEMPAHTHLKLTPYCIALTLTYCTLSRSRRRIRNSCKKNQKSCRYVLQVRKITHWKTKRREKRKGWSKRWSASCQRIVCGGSGLQTMI
jgi:hypothetical protein